MKQTIKTLIDSVQAQCDYIESNNDFTEAFDDVLADDSCYHSEQWRDAVQYVIGERELTEDLYDYIVSAVLEDISGYCDVSAVIRGFPHRSEAGCIASFGIGEQEFQIDCDSPFIDGIAAYLNRHSDWHWIAYKEAGHFLVYADYSYSSVDYVLKDEAIAELLAAYDEEMKGE